MPILNTDVVEIVVDGAALNQQIVNVFHYRNANEAGAPVEDSDFIIMVNDFRTLWRTHVLPHLSDFYGVEFYRGRVLHDVINIPLPADHNAIGVSLAQDVPGEGPDNGGLSGEAAPTFVAAGVRKLTNRTGRNFRGSYRLGPLVEAQIINNIWADGILAPLQTAQNTFAAASIATGAIDVFEPVVFSETLTLAEAVGFTNLRAHTALITGARVSPFISSQVSRKQRGAGSS